MWIKVDKLKNCVKLQLHALTSMQTYMPTHTNRYFVGFMVQISWEKTFWWAAPLSKFDNCQGFLCGLEGVYLKSRLLWWAVAISLSTSRLLWHMTTQLLSLSHQILQPHPPHPSCSCTVFPCLIFPTAFTSTFQAVLLHYKFVGFCISFTIIK